MSLTSLPAPANAAVIYTANLTVQVKEPAQAAQQAAQLALTAGGYVSGENATLAHAHPGGPAVTMQLKVPVAAYANTLTALTRLGATLKQTQQAIDATQAVADVASRVTSAEQAIRQLRTLLARAGTVDSLLTVQDQVNSEESSLEALQAQQRALARETTFATISLALTTPPAHHARKKVTHAAAGGFTFGLRGGWHALRTVVSVGLTVLGAVLPFAVPLALLYFLWLRARSWLSNRPRRLNHPAP
ncbi:MAG TPA: DUF4349 domain-containing protein [Streptosporangiaceae bacterium]|nr:DUF4349 domain-containing protein [Streptosporangiaceae bacterium]